MPAKRKVKPKPQYLPAPEVSLVHRSIKATFGLDERGIYKMVYTSHAGDVLDCEYADDRWASRTDRSGLEDYARYRIERWIRWQCEGLITAGRFSPLEVFHGAEPLFSPEVRQ